MRSRFIQSHFLFLASLSIAYLFSSIEISAQTKKDSPQICPANLSAEIAKIRQAPQLTYSRLGVVVSTLSQPPQILVNLDGDKYFIPASNGKLFVTAAALKLFKPSDRIRTSLLSIDPPTANGEIGGGLYVVGRGDPSFSSKSSLRSLVSQLVAKGVKRINGGLIPLGQFHGSGLGDGWEWQDLQEDYAAISSPFSIDENVIDWTINPSKINQHVKFTWDSPTLAAGWQIQNQATTGKIDSAFTLEVNRPLGQKQLIITGSMPENAQPELGATAVPDPEAHFLRLLADEITKQGIRIDLSTTPLADLKQGSQPQVELAVVTSPPISDLVKITNKTSNNFYAESLLRILGTRFNRSDRDASHTGIQVVTDTLHQQGISANSFLLADGSGLSRKNSIAPIAIVQLLRIMSVDRTFWDSMSIAGVDGTLKNRFKDTPAEANLRGKTGNLSGVAALSGYIKPANYDRLAFSIAINNSNQSGKELRQYIDSIVLLLNRLRHC